MTENMGAILSAITEVKDNIWLGDFVTAEKIANSQIKELNKKLDVTRLQDDALELREIARDLRKLAKDKDVSDVDDFVAEELFARMKSLQITPQDNLSGVTLFYLMQMRDMLTHILRLKGQKTLVIDEKDTDKFEIITKERYRYSVHRLPSRWDVRVFLDSSVKQPLNLKAVKKGEWNLNLQFPEESEDSSRITFELFSSELYAEVLAEGRLLELSIHVSQASNEMQKIKGITESIVSLLTSSTQTGY